MEANSVFYVLLEVCFEKKKEQVSKNIHFCVGEDLLKTKEPTQLPTEYV